MVVLDQAKEFYPPASVRLGIAPERTIVVQAATIADNLWALDQSLRCPGVAVALAWLERLDSRTFRRLQLAAEQGGSLGFFLRPERARHEPSWADMRFWVEPCPVTIRGDCLNFRGGGNVAAEKGSSAAKMGLSLSSRRRLKIQLLRSRRGASGSVEVEIDDETHAVHLAPPLVNPAVHRRAAGA